MILSYLTELLLVLYRKGAELFVLFHDEDSLLHQSVEDLSTVHPVPGRENRGNWEELPGVAVGEKSDKVEPAASYILT